MGQRSQMYVIAKENDKYYLTANYYQWNYRERMISRARGTLEQIVDEYLKYTWYLTNETTKLRRIMDVNWDMHDIVLSSDIVKEFAEDYEEYWKTEGNTYAEDFFNFCFAGQDNNNGQMYMFVDLDVPEEERVIELGFTVTNFDGEIPVVSAAEYLDYDCEREEDGNWKKYMDESEYYNRETIEYTEANIRYISEHSKQLDSKKLNGILKMLCMQQEEEYNRINPTAIVS